MALAYLFKELTKKDVGRGLGLTALIIDHGHRPDSQLETWTVSTWLNNLGGLNLQCQCFWWLTLGQASDHEC